MSIFTSRPGSFGRPQAGWSWWRSSNAVHTSRNLGVTND